MGHDHAAGGADSPFWLGRSDRIRHLHLHDALGRRNHLLLGEGDVDLRARLSSCAPLRVVVEVKAKEELRRSVAWLKNHG